ncbi:RNA polymerase sigma-70 factor [Cellulophaga fucicola]|uniref:RNA polymerase sigma-70 factor, ECF subfamily n=1 Tax=Cellulophaga fucicola TaxID=76595 RepID=A0A1K1MWU4_9FLAO|nr:RNA polymerase sigma-70 factor [Cellulophaga fucicola]SFW27632.1 RNA polymerase sigma-70 factor, ECF subfamily [Cellulophaga fucicola]
MNLREQEIVNRLKEEDPKAFKDLFDMFYMPLCVYSLKFSDSYDFSEDIVQDLFVTIWNKKIYLQVEGSIRSYLFKAVKNNTLQALKKKDRYNFEKLDAVVESFILEEKENDIEAIEKAQKKLLQEIEALPEKSKEVFKAIVLENLKYKEVALQLGVTVNTVKTHYSRALKKLRKSLDVIILLLLY